MTDGAGIARRHPELHAFLTRPDSDRHRPIRIQVEETLDQPVGFPQPRKTPNQECQRYQEHEARGSHILLFARNRSDERAFYFLGPATYVSHEGELPMAITWRLQYPLPGDLFASFAAAVA